MAKVAYGDFLKEITLTKTTDFTANGENGTNYVISGSSADVEITLEASAAETRYLFVNESDTHVLKIYPADGETLKYWNEAGNDVRTVTGGVSEWLQVPSASSVEIIKTSAENWTVINGVGHFKND